MDQRDWNKNIFFHSDQLKKNKRGSIKPIFFTLFFLHALVLSAGEIIGQKKISGQIRNVLESSQKNFQTLWTHIDGFIRDSLGGEKTWGFFPPLQILIPISFSLTQGVAVHSRPVITQRFLTCRSSFCSVVYQESFAL